jgi:hypothetical protein|tara:strand:+ start:2760 stop:3080 length:321 start_codon:yes stop_codon:yes gene_type:complete
MTMSSKLSDWLEDEEQIDVSKRPTVSTQAEKFTHFNQQEKVEYLLLTSPVGVCHNEFMAHYIPRFGALIWKLRHEKNWIIDKIRCSQEEHNHQSPQYLYKFMGREI